jgi:hypothetical protein
MTDFNHDRWEAERLARLARVQPPVQEPTLFERCVGAIAEIPIDNGEDRNAYAVGDDARTLVRAVLTTLRDHTGSPYTVDELTRVLADAP